MKLLSFIFAIGFCGSLFANEKDSFSFGIEGGYGTYGVIGLEYSKFITQHMDIHLGVGVGLVGGIAGVGTQFYTTKKECFLLKHCHDQLLFDLTFTRSSGGRTKITKDEVERTYKKESINFANVGIGSRTLLFNTLALDAMISYRFSERKLEPTLTEGPDDEVAEEDIDIITTAHKDTPLFTVALTLVI